MKLRSGKYAGKDIEYVRRVAPWYINWVRVNRPEMLKERTSKKIPIVSNDTINSIHSDNAWVNNIKPNLDFDTHPSELYKILLEEPIAEIKVGVKKDTSK
jgi:hypothetical protein